MANLLAMMKLALELKKERGPIHRHTSNSKEGRRIIAATKNAQDIRENLNGNSRESQSRRRERSNSKRDI